MSNRTFIIICLILLSGIATNWIIEDAEQDALPDPVAKNDPDLYMVDARITQFNEHGTPQHKINAQRMTHFPLTNVTTLRVPNLLLYQEGEAAMPWDIIAKNGRLLPKSRLSNEIVELWDQVIAVRDQRDGHFINIETESLTVYPDQDFVETSMPVSIDNRRGRTTAGGGMKGDLTAGLFEFFSSTDGKVRTVLSPRLSDDMGANPG